MFLQMFYVLLPNVEHQIDEKAKVTEYMEVMREMLALAFPLTLQGFRKFKCQGRLGQSG